jgi:gliding motility-associated-like protein
VKKMLAATLALILFCGNVIIAQTTNLSGVINRYSAVSAINGTGTTITLSNASAFSAGDRILIVQMKGVTIDATNTASFGDITGSGLAGNHEFATIQSIAGSIATLRNPLCQSYNPAEIVQIVSAPKYKNVNIIATVTADPWDGTQGGIVVIDATDTISFNDIIDVTGQGFKGGNICSGAFGCSTGSVYFDTYTALPIPSCTGGFKGESVSIIPFGITNTNLGKNASGGGGSNLGNNGGGGGGNGADGGRSGDEYSNCSGTPSLVWARGGASNPLTNGKLFFAGGGGGGYEDNGSVATPGGNAGGTVVLRAAHIQGNAFGIVAAGDDVATISSDEGAGGGGAGGTVHIHCNSILSSLFIAATGGEGGSNDNIVYPTECHGPGGGGAGGQLWVSGPVIPANILYFANGGFAGTVNNAASTCFGTSYNATDGGDGVDNIGLLPILSADDKPDLGKDTLLCANTNIVLNPGSFTAYLWSTGAVTPTITVNTPGTYWVRVPRCNGTFARDTIVIGTQPSPAPNLGPDTVICAGQAVNLYPGAFPFYAWSNGAPNSSILVNTTGTYSVVVTDLNGCTGTDSRQVTVTIVNAIITSNVLDSLCLPTPLVVNSLSSGGVTNFKYDFGDGTIVTGSQAASHLYTTPGLYYYSLVVSNPGGCRDSTGRNIYVGAQIPVGFEVDDKDICVGENLACLDTGTQYAYSWQYNFDDGLTLQNVNNPVHVFESDGNYAVTLSVKYLACPAVVKTINVNVQNTPQVNLGPDTSYCAGRTGPIPLINTGNSSSAASYLWNNGSTSNAITVAQPGTYWIKASTSNGCENTDTIIVAEDCYLNIPNAFTPNNDRENDYFMPMNLMSNGVKSYSMEIFNRWGEVVFSTNNVNSRGWDGELGNKPQPMGVYVYVIKVTYDNLINKVYKGNVTLVR